MFIDYNCTLLRSVGAQAQAEVLKYAKNCIISRHLIIFTQYEVKKRQKTWEIRENFLTLHPSYL